MRAHHVSRGAKSTWAAGAAHVGVNECEGFSGGLAGGVRTPPVALRACPVVGSGGKRADRVLHLGGECGEFLCPLTDLLVQLRAELDLLLQQLCKSLGAESRAHTER